MSQAGIASLNNIEPGQLDLHVAKLIVNVNGTVGTGANYSSLTSAMAAAVSGDTIFLMPGTYTENVTLKPGVAISSFSCDGLNGNVIINGTLTMTGAGTCSLSGMRLQTNSAPFLTISGSAASIVNLKDCYLNCANNTGISYTSSSSSSKVNVINCSGNIATTGISLFSMSSSGVLFFEQSNITNTGNSTTASTISTGMFQSEYSSFDMPITTSGTSNFDSAYTSYFTGATNSTAITIGGTGGAGGINYSFTDEFSTGTATAISVGSNLIITLAAIASSNTNAISGAGTITYGTLDFNGTTSKINTSTQTALTSQVGSLNILTPLSVSSPQTLVRDSVTGKVGVSSSSSGFTSIVNQVFTSNGTYTPTSGMKYCSIQILGGGGAGGGAQATDGVSQYSTGAGGGSGEYATGIFSAATIGVSQTVTIGAGGLGDSSGLTGGNGGNSSVGVLISANGGTGGPFLGQAGSGGPINGGPGGTGGSGGDYRTPGANGTQTAFDFAFNSVVVGVGANSQLGSGGLFSIFSTGGAGLGYGAGGGGVFNGSSGSNTAGGNGAPGIVIITEYI